MTGNTVSIRGSIITKPGDLNQILFIFLLFEKCFFVLNQNKKKWVIEAGWRYINFRKRAVTIA